MNDTETTDHEYAAVHEASKDSTARHQITGRHIGKVIDAYDGDTCRVAIALPTWGGAPVVEYLNVRMLGYDSPEMKKAQLTYGREVKAVFHAFVLDTIVVLDIPVPEKPDPYGRVLAHMYALERGAPHPSSPLPYQPPGPGALNGAGTDSTLGTRGTVALEVRKQAVNVPVTVDVPSDCVLDDASLARLTHVNAWMVANAHVKEYGGGAARTDWSADEIEHGVSEAPPLSARR